MKLIKYQTVFFFLYTVLSHGMLEEIKAGTKFKASSLGISKIVDITKKIAHKMLPNLALPGVSGDKGDLHYEAWNIKIDAVLNLDYEASIAPNDSLIVTVKDVSLTASGQWKYVYDGFIPFRDHGIFTVAALGLKLDTRFRTGMDARGMITIQYDQCSGRFDVMSLDFHNWFCNLYKKDIENQINRPCDIVRNVVIKATSELQRLSPQISIGHDVVFDARLLSAPKMNADEVEFEIKGEFIFRGDSREAPFQPNPLPTAWKTSRPLALEVTEYIFNTLSYVTHKHGMQAGNITRFDLPASIPELFNTKCSRFICLGFLIPQLGRLYPNSFVEVHYETSSYPVLRVTDAGVSSFATNAYHFRARFPDGKLAQLFSMSTNISIKASMWTDRKSPIIHWKIDDLKMEATLTDTQIGWFPDKAGVLVLNVILRLIAVPKIDKQGSIGRRLPLPENFVLYNTKLHLSEGFATIESDFDYNA